MPLLAQRLDTLSFPGRACHPLNLEAEGMAMTIVERTRPVTGGVDTHADVHIAAAVDANGGVLGVESFATTPAGYAQLHGWLAGFGPVDRVGVEGTGAYGAGLARHLRGRGLVVVEVDRPNRQERRRNGKSDELDAIEAARAVLSGRASGIGRILTAGRSEVTALGDEMNETARIEACATGGRTLASKALVERLNRADAQALRLDTDRVLYTPLAELPTATDKARRDAPAIAVCDLTNSSF